MSPQRATGVARLQAPAWLPCFACCAEQGDTTYQSPILHHVLLRDLEPGVTYFYSVGETAAPANSSSDGRAAIVRSVHARA